MRLVTTDTLDRILEADPNKYHERAYSWGERAWRVRGRYGHVVYWDMSNTWCDIIAVFPKKGQQKWLRKFFRAVEKSKDEDIEYPDDGFVIKRK